MTKKLEEILDLPDSKEIIKQDKEKEQHNAIQQQNETLREIAEMDKARGEKESNSVGDILSSRRKVCLHYWAQHEKLIAFVT